MSSVGLVPNKDLCRCCHSKGKFKSLSDPCPRSKEAYSDMLRFCFEVNLTPIPGMHCISTYKICNLCIIKLQNAVEFKNSVLTCEDQFRDMYSKSLQVKEEHSDVIEIKEESSDEELIGICEKTAPVTLVGTQSELEPEGMKTEDEDDGLSDGDFDLSGEGTDEDVKKEIEQYESKAAEQRKANMGKKQASTAKRKGTENKDGAAPQKKKKSKGAARESDAYYTILEDSKRYACKACSGTYGSLASVVQHYRHVHLHLRPKLRSCYLCNIKVPAHTRAQHLEEAHEIPAPTCKACGKKFAYPFQVLRHQKTFHMGERTFGCPHCTMLFTSQFILKQHLAKHSEERRFKCQYCEKAFKWKKNLKTHVMMHLNDRRHVCTVCNESFIQQSSLKYHMTRKHSVVL